VLDRASRDWRGVTMTPAAVRQLQELCHQLFLPVVEEEVTAATNKSMTAAA
jgi:hypothetical protein